MAEAPEIRVELAPDRRPQRVSVLGLPVAALTRLRAAGPSSWPLALQVYTGRAPGTRQPAIAGEYALDDHGLHFAPRFAFLPRLPYVARFAASGVSLEKGFEIAAAPAEAPRIVGVYPSAHSLPENTLRLYVHFSVPMAAGGVQRHVRLFDVDEGEQAMPFVDVEQGLWDPGQTRLTLIFHPGRIKRGVAPGEELGPVLRAGHAYRLEIDAALGSQAGVRLGSIYRHEFRATAADRVSPTLADIHIGRPAGPSGPLRVELPEPLDHGLLQRLVWVEDPGGATVEGHAEVSDNERVWSFVPTSPWSAGRHTLRIHPLLEDRAGNRFDRVFDRDESAPAPSTDTEPLSIPFDATP